MGHVLVALLSLVGGALAAAAYRVQVDDLQQPPERALATVAVGLAFLAAGLVVWMQRSDNRLGPLMTLTAFALLARQLRYSDNPAVFTAFFAVGEVSYALVGHSILAYPTGRLMDRLERAVVGAGYAVVLIFPLAILLCYDGSRPLNQFVSAPRESLLLVVGSAEAADVLQQTFVVVFYGGLGALLIALVARRITHAPPGAPFLVLPLLVASLAVAHRGVYETASAFGEAALAREHLFWWQAAALIALPAALFAGVFGARFVRLPVPAEEGRRPATSDRRPREEPLLSVVPDPIPDEPAAVPVVPAAQGPEGGLNAALRAFVDQAPLPVALEAPTGQLPGHVQTVAYSVVSEALTNVVKHSKASRASVAVRQAGGAVTIEVEDDGRGGARFVRGAGLRGLAELVEAHGGTFTVASGRYGTCVTAELPLGTVRAVS